MEEGEGRESNLSKETMIILNAWVKLGNLSVLRNTSLNKVYTETQSLVRYTDVVCQILQFFAHFFQVRNQSLSRLSSNKKLKQRNLCQICHPGKQCGHGKQNDWQLKLSIHHSLHVLWDFSGIFQEFFSTLLHVFWVFVFYLKQNFRSYM